jgi:hypothetical protein
MGKKTPSVPSVTDTAAAQTGSNISTAIGQQQLNAINQVGPAGSVSYSQNGTYDFTDPSTGKTYKLPKLTQTTSLSPTGQQIYDTGQATSLNLANVAKDASGRIGGLISQPFDISNDAVEARLMELGSKRLTPQLDQRREAEATRLSNAGIKLGSTAYDRAQMNLNQGENDAYNQLLLNGRGQAVNETLLARQQPINEILALAGQGQLAMPSFGAGAPQTALAGTDIAGITQANYANQTNAYNQQQSQLGGLFGTLGTLGSAALTLSDERTKTDIVDTGERTEDGIPLKTFRYLFDKPGTERHGVIAQDVQKRRPDAVAKIGGLLAVRNDKIPEAAHG